MPIDSRRARHAARAQLRSHLAILSLLSLVVVRLVQTPGGTRWRSRVHHYNTRSKDSLPEAVPEDKTLVFDI